MTWNPDENRSLRTPTALLPYQQAWVADTSPVKVCEKSRRVGLSWAEAAASALEASRAGGQDTYYIGYNQDMAREFIEDVGDWGKHYNLAASQVQSEVIRDEDKDILTYRVRFASGFKVVALSSRPSNLRGKQGRVVIDEAAFHPDLRGLIKAGLALLIWGGSVSIISTHDGDDNPFNELILDIRAKKYDYSLHRITITDALDAGLYERTCLRLGRPYSKDDEAAWLASLEKLYQPNADEELHCIPAGSAGSYFTRVVIESCMGTGIPVLRFECDDQFVTLLDTQIQAAVGDWLDENVAPLLAALPKNQRHFFGEDFGRSGDLSVIAPLTQQQNLSLRCPFLVELRNVPFEAQKQVLFFIGDGLPRFSGGALDSRGNGQYTGEVCMQRWSASRIHQVMLSNSFYLSHMPPFKAAFEDRTITIPQDSDVLDDLRQIKVVKGVPKLADDARSKGQDGKQRHGDAAIALMLAHYAVKNTSYGEVKYESVAPRKLAGLGRGSW